MKIFLIGIAVLSIVSLSFTACNYSARADDKHGVVFTSLIKPSPVKKTSSKEAKALDKIELSVSAISSTEQDMIKDGLVDIKKVDSSIVVNVKYSTTDNFLGIDIYGDFNKCYLQPDVAQKLKLAQQYLKLKYPYYSLIIYDGARPHSVQYKMWDSIHVPHDQRSKYLSNPKEGSLHNFGAAVDVSIIDEHGYVVDMGTKYDYFGELAYPREEERLLNEGKLSHNQVLSREVLRDVMHQAGFWSIATEWWHFNSCYLSTAYTKYKIID
jgi:D-alanyl-D-alanine dipeptidase